MRIPNAYYNRAKSHFVLLEVLKHEYQIEWIPTGDVSNMFWSQRSTGRWAELVNGTSIHLYGDGRCLANITWNALLATELVEGLVYGSIKTWGQSQ